jgi:hypothetical protein
MQAIGGQSDQAFKQQVPFRCRQLRHLRQSSATIVATFTAKPVWTIVTDVVDARINGTVQLK